jgi:hypothetical protein
VSTIGVGDIEHRPPRATATEPLRIGLIVAGAVSLGSYEAGAMTALMNLVRGSDGQIVIDTIVGASAGSISGLLLAHALLRGERSPTQLDLWVEKTDMRVLLKRRPIAGRPRGPLSPADLLDWAAQQLRDAPGGIQREPIAVVMSIANLQGLSYRMAMQSHEEPVRADTFRDAIAFWLTPDTEDEVWSEAMDAAEASSAHAFAFSAVRLARERSDYPPEVVIESTQPRFWYTDGGTVYNEPFGLALDAVYSPHDLGPHIPERETANESRLFLLVHPHPADPLSPWPPGGSQPLFAQSSLRAFNMQRAQSLYEDMLKLEKYNGRVRWRARIEQAMSNAGLESADWVRTIADEAASERAARRAKTKGGSEPSGPDTAPERSNIATILDAATGTAGKRLAWVEVVSPDIDARVRTEGATMSQLLAGERLGHFLGFAAQEARRSDFRLGYENLATWWRGDDTLEGFRGKCDLPALDVPPHECSRWPWKGDFSLADVPWTTRTWWSIVLLRRYFQEARALLRRSKTP